MNPTVSLIIVGGIIAAIVAAIVVPKMKKAAAHKKKLAQYNKDLLDDMRRGLDNDALSEMEENSFVEHFHLNEP